MLRSSRSSPSCRPGRADCRTEPFRAPYCHAYPDKHRHSYRSRDSRVRPLVERSACPLELLEP